MSDYQDRICKLRRMQDLYSQTEWIKESADAIEALLAERDDWHEVADLRAAELVRLGEELDSQPSDARRYRWLREQHWDDSQMCVVRDPKYALKLGSWCPSGALLDSEIDAAMQESSDDQA